MTCPGSHSQWVVEKVSNLGLFVSKKPMYFVVAITVELSLCGRD